jgi:hypothetical protein
MRALLLICLSILGVGICGEARADFVGNNDEGVLNFVTAGNGSFTDLNSDGGGQLYSSQNSVGWDGTIEVISVASIISQTATSWEFGAGELSANPEVNGLVFVPIPSGYPTCEAAGLSTNPNGPPACVFTPTISGTILDATLTETLQSGAWVFDLSGSVEFNISDNLAVGWGIATGPYFGSFDTHDEFYAGIPFLNPESPNSEQYEIAENSLEFSGTTVPEPSTLLLFATAAQWYC